jgi:hypothetical protein
MIGNLVAGMVVRTGAFSPADIAGLKAWYDASDTSTISVSGSAVTQWNDKSINGYNVSQATGTKQPQSGTTTLNGKNVITFDGGDRLVAASAADWKFLHDGSTSLVGMVIKFSSSSNPNQLLTAMSTETAADTTTVGASFNLEDRVAAGLNNANRCAITKGTGGQYVVLQDNNNAITPDSATVITHLIDGDNATAADRWATFVGTGSALKANTATNAVSTANPTYALNIGWNQGETFSGITGYLAEIVIISGADATETNRVKIRDYLKDKWAV